MLACAININVNGTTSLGLEIEFGLQATHPLVEFVAFVSNRDKATWPACVDAAKRTGLLLAVAVSFFKLASNACCGLVSLEKRPAELAGKVVVGCEVWLR